MKRLTVLALAALVISVVAFLLAIFDQQSQISYQARELARSQSQRVLSREETCKKVKGMGLAATRYDVRDRVSVENYIAAGSLADCAYYGRQFELKDTDARP